MTRIYIFSDAHLDTKNPNLTIKFCEQIAQIDAPNSLLVILGDLFVIWTAMVIQLPIIQNQVFEQFKLFQNNGGKILFIVGNKDIFFKNKLISEKIGNLADIFDWVENNYAILNMFDKIILLHHGDLINPNDKNNLFLRSVLKNFIIYELVNLMPRQFIKWLTDFIVKKYEKNKIKDYNFPTTIWINWLKMIKKIYSPNIAIIGHYHPEKLIDTEIGAFHGIVIPNWSRENSYLMIDKQGYYLL